MLAQVISGGVVVNVAVLPDGSTIAGNGGSWTAPDAVTHPAPAGCSLMVQSGAGEGWMLSAGALVPPSLPAPQLRAYAAARADKLRFSARPYTLTGGLVATCDATQGTGSDLVGLKTWGDANTGATTLWVQNDGGVVTLTGAQCVELASAVLAYGQSVFATLALGMNGIANGAITTTAQIAALSWPA